MDFNEMNCEECQESISMFLDGELGELQAASVRAHITLCVECAKLCEDFASILDSCREMPPSEIVPPNSKALWCRINNLIESESKPEPKPEENVRGRFWKFSFLQIGSAAAAVAMISSLLTVVAIRNYLQPTPDDLTLRSEASQTTFEKILSKVGLSDTPQQARERRLREQQAAIEYWNKRVTLRRAQWDTKIRDAFDRNLHEIDQAVSEYTLILQSNPQDELSGEMLDTALNEKMNLLREFSDL